MAPCSPGMEVRPCSKHHLRPLLQLLIVLNILHMHEFREKPFDERIDSSDAEVVDDHPEPCKNSKTGRIVWLYGIFGEWLSNCPVVAERFDKGIDATDIFVINRDEESHSIPALTSREEGFGRGEGRMEAHFVEIAEIVRDR